MAIARHGDLALHCCGDCEEDPETLHYTVEAIVMHGDLTLQSGHRIARRTQRPHITLLRRLRGPRDLRTTGVRVCEARGPCTTIYELYLRLVSPKKYADWCSVKSKSAT